MGVVRRRVAHDLWLRAPARARSLLLSTSDDGLVDDGPSLALLAWLELTLERDEKVAEVVARQALLRSPTNRLAPAVLAEVLARRDEHEEAIHTLTAARRAHPDVPWYDLTLADAMVAGGQIEAAESILEAAVDDPRLRRHALKRLSRLALDRGDAAAARRRFEALVGLAPDYLVYASDYVVLGTLQLDAGDAGAARATWRRGSEVYPRHQRLRALLAEHFGDPGSRAQPRIACVAETSLGVRRIPVRTELITIRRTLHETIDEATAGVRRPDDVIALSESAAAAGQGRMLPLELIEPGVLATTLCRFVGEIGPLHSPQGMQGAIMESGRLRIVAGAAAGAVGKVLGRRGWFYRVAGPAVAMIDDVAGCLPPHDHHVIFGPADPDGLATELAQRLGSEVAIVDANHRSGAWVVGSSPGVDRRWLSQVLVDNPAGNEDEQTPVVVVRRVTA
jgi:tetratricopeptide (TPR) repeat protein